MSFGEYLLGGKITLLKRRNSPYKLYELTPEQTRRIFVERGWSRVIGFHTRNVVHKSHEFVQMEGLRKSCMQPKHAQQPDWAPNWNYHPPPLIEGGHGLPGGPYPLIRGGGLIRCVVRREGRARSVCAGWYGFGLPSVGLPP